MTRETSSTGTTKPAVTGVTAGSAGQSVARRASRNYATPRPPAAPAAARVVACKWPGTGPCRTPGALACSIAFAHTGAAYLTLCDRHAASWLSTTRPGDAFTAERLS